MMVCYLPTSGRYRCWSALICELDDRVKENGRRRTPMEGFMCNGSPFIIAPGPKGSDSEASL
jgi:hypothetical protein